MDDRMIVGWREWVQLPATGRGFIRAKMDTGARTSALHAYGLRTEHADGADWALFHLLGRKGEAEQRFLIKEYRSIRSSNGMTEDRPVIALDMCMGGHTWQVEVTLTDREQMAYRMLVGREAMSGRILVDPSRSHILGRHLQGGSVHE
ncbi:ATP-dependent zinc protease family protein [Halovulum sp. GXIMD14794]